MVNEVMENEIKMELKLKQNIGMTANIAVVNSAQKILNEVIEQKNKNRK